MPPHPPDAPGPTSAGGSAGSSGSAGSAGSAGSSGSAQPAPLRVLLTGATGGIGPSIAAALHRSGARLALSALPEPDLDDLAAGLRGGGERAAGGRAGAADLPGDAPRVVAIPADLRDPSAPGRLVAAAIEALGGIDVLVHNAGMEHVGRYEGQSPESLEAVMRVNLLSAMELSRLLLPGMAERGWGRLVFVSSASARTGPAYTGAYSVSKAGLRTLARTLREEYRGTGIRASAVLPGFVSGGGMYDRGRERAGFRGSWVLGTVPPDAVARAVVRAIERGTGEILVQRGPVRLVLALADLLPGLVGDRLNRWVGADRIFREWAASRSRESSDATAGEAGSSRARDPEAGGSS